MKNILCFVAMFVLIALSMSVFAAAASESFNVTVSSSESGYLSRYLPLASFSSLNSDKANMMYYYITGKESAGSSVHYEWFNLSSIPSGATIISAQLHVTHDQGKVGVDGNKLMVPKQVKDSQRVTLAKLQETFSPTDTYAGNGKKYKNQSVLSKVDSVNLLQGDSALDYDVTDVVTGWVSGQPNFGFALLGNYNSLGYGATNYYFSNSALNNPRLTIAYSVPNDTGVTSICEYASSADATSENQNSLASYAVSAPNSPSAGECANWGGPGTGWTPVNWDVKANLTLHYDQPISVTNMTVFGDYDLCWSKMWLKNSQTGKQMTVLNTFTTSCDLTLSNTYNFLADTVILQTCGWSWSATDAVQLCGTVNTSKTSVTQNASICKWKNCEKGAVSVSADDSYTSCTAELEDNGYRETYFLSNTNNTAIYTPQLWGQFTDAFNKGHEIGSHTEDHICYEVTDDEFFADMERNINDITNNTNVTRFDIVTHAYPCGNGNGTNIETSLRNNWNFIASRGYDTNQVESSTPSNFFNLKSYNSHGYPGNAGEPPSYFDALNEAEQQGKWFIYVFHNQCSDDGSINTLPARHLWVDTIGNVARYIKIRDSTELVNYTNSSSEITFNLNTNLTNVLYKQNLTVGVAVNDAPLSAKMNSQPVAYTWNPDGYILLNLPFPAQGQVIITK